ncbi:MAG: hypothetical protein KKD39_02560 [Candidatus Altiarchaeota archaeon]|nr:hypothetical protein [Candidatus Altiarchaeota archaeon]
MDENGDKICDSDKPLLTTTIQQTTTIPIQTTTTIEEPVDDSNYNYTLVVGSTVDHFSFDDYVDGVLSGQDGWGGTTDDYAMDVQSEVHVGQSGKALVLNDPKDDNKYHTHSLTPLQQLVYTVYMRREGDNADTTTYIKDDGKDILAINYVDGHALKIGTKEDVIYNEIKTGRWYRIDIAIDCINDMVPWIRIDNITLAENMHFPGGRTCNRIDNIRLAWNSKYNSDTYMDEIKVSKLIQK